MSAVTRVLSYGEGPEGFDLYIGEISTSDGLAPFDPQTTITILEFGATGFEHLGWATERDIPPLRTAGEARAFLERDALGLITFSARLGDDISISSHDDGECHIRFRQRKTLLAVLQQLVPPAHAGRILHALFSNPGRYLVWDGDGAVTTFATFEAYLRAR
jgi:hypothetical protein